MSGLGSSFLLIALAAGVFGLALWYLRRASRAARSRVGTPVRRPAAAAAKVAAPTGGAKAVLARAAREDAGSGSPVAEPTPRVNPSQPTVQMYRHPISEDPPAEEAEAEAWEDTVAETWKEPAGDPGLTTGSDTSALPPEPGPALSESSATVPALKAVEQLPLAASVGAVAAAVPEPEGGPSPAAAMAPGPAGDLRQTTAVAAPVPGHPLLRAIDRPAEGPQAVVPASAETNETAPTAATPASDASVASAALRSAPLPTVEQVEAVAPALGGPAVEPDQAAQPAVPQTFVAGTEGAVKVAEPAAAQPGEAREDEPPRDPVPGPFNAEDLTSGEIPAVDAELQALATDAAAAEPLLEAKATAEIDLVPAVEAAAGVAETARLSAEGDAEADAALETMPGAHTGIDAEVAGINPDAGTPETSSPTMAAAARPLTRQAVHRDRRGRPAAVPQPPEQEVRKATNANGARPSAEVRLRLSIHPIRRTVQLALVLMRPEEFPPSVTLQLDEPQTVDALDDRQYGDVDLEWGAGLLASEIRLTCAEGFRWVRSARLAHIFAADPAEPDLVTVAFATAGIEHTVVCRNEDARAVCDLAESAGSSRPKALERFTGIADGWVVLTGYRPTRAAAVTPSAAFSPLDPGHAIAISLEGGLAIGGRSFAQGKPPRIGVEPALDGVSVRIGGVEATPRDGGGWEAPGWDAPGPHLIDVVPGPTLKYEIIADPAANGGWAFWDAHPDRAAASEGPWARAAICGAGLAGPSGEKVLAAEVQPTLLALGIDGSVASLRPRAGVGVSVGLAGGTPAFLLVSSGRRRTQGKVVWLGLAEATASLAHVRQALPIWVEAVRGAAARRLPVDAGEEGAGESAWRMAVTLARAIKRQRR